MQDQERNESTETEGAAAAADAVMDQSAHEGTNDTVSLRGELAAARDRALRAQAELENSRRRMRKEMEDERRYAQLPLLGDLLPVIDNVQRAIQAAEKSPEAGGLLAGFKMVAQQLEGVLSRHHCTRIDALHKPFDPHLHAAILQQPSNEYPPNTVVHVAQDGYQLHDRVLRPAQVIVSTSAADSDGKRAET
ncbi:MAG TPA: nucleotide exchange factor GrpE [Pirellulales bacterium]|nr:nucleotide exchange factor GrpE [Pirellulales bacterium]